MNDLIEARFIHVDTLAVARLAGSHSAAVATHWIGETLAWARLRRFHRVLISIVDLTGVQPPSLARRVEMIREWADAAGSDVAVAFVCRPEFIDPQKFGITVAAGFGVTANVFSREEPAMDWLRSLP